MKNKRMEKYFVSNEKEGTTVAVMFDTPMGISEEAKRKTSKMTFDLINYINNKKLIDDDCKNPLFESEVKCVNGDVFDKRIGKDIAGCVSDKKYHIAMSKRYRRVLKILFKAIEEIETLIAFHDKKVSNINNDLNNYYN